MPAQVGGSLGLYLTRSPLALPAGAVQDGNNFRVQHGNYNNQFLGWEAFNSIQLNGPVTLIDDFIKSDGTDVLILGTPTDLYRYRTGTSDVRFISPHYETGTAAASGTSVTGTGTTWSTNASTGDEISFGTAGQDDPAATWYTITNVGGNTAITLSATAGTVVDGPYTIRRLFHGTFLTHWDSETFLYDASGDDLWFATNGVDNIVKWDGTGTQVTSKATWTGGMTLKAGHIVRFNNMLIFGDITVNGEYFPTSILNTDLGDPEATTGGIASQFLIHDEADHIIDMQRLGDNLAIYSSRNIVLAQFLGDPFIFSFRKAVNNRGAIGPRTVATFADYHEFLAQDSQYRFDGASAQPIGAQVWPVVLAQMDYGRVNAAFWFFDDRYPELVWAVPQITDTGAVTAGTPVNTAYSEHYLEPLPQGVPVPVGRRDFPFTIAGSYRQLTAITWASLSSTTWAAFTLAWNDPSFLAASPIILAGDINGYVYRYGASHNAAGDGLVSNVVYGQKTVDGRERPLIKRIYPFVNNVATVDFDMRTYLQVTDGSLGSVTRLGPYLFNTDYSTHFVSPFRRGRYFATEFESLGPDQPYELIGYDLDVSPGGST